MSAVEEFDRRFHWYRCLGGRARHLKRGGQAVTIKGGNGYGLGERRGRRRAGGDAVGSRPGGSCTHRKSTLFNGPSFQSSFLKATVGQSVGDGGCG